MKKSNYIKRIAAILTILTFRINTFSAPSYAQTLESSNVNLSTTANMVSVPTSFNPAVIRGINLIPNEPLKFDFLIEKSSLNMNAMDFKKESNKLIKYFLAALTIPDKEKWVTH